MCQGGSTVRMQPSLAPLLCAWPQHLKNQNMVYRSSLLVVGIMNALFFEIMYSFIFVFTNHFHFLYFSNLKSGFVLEVWLLNVGKLQLRNSVPQSRSRSANCQSATTACRHRWVSGGEFSSPWCHSAKRLQKLKCRSVQKFLLPEIVGLLFAIESSALNLLLFLRMTDMWHVYLVFTQHWKLFEAIPNSQEDKKQIQFTVQMQAIWIQSST